MRQFVAKGGWWVVAQGLWLAGIAGAWVLWGAPWGVAALAGGAALAGLGAALAVGGAAALGRHLSVYPAPRPDAALVEHGPYRLARHPIYGGLVLAAAGLAVVDGNWPALVLAGGLAMLLWGKSGSEERRLASRFPGYGAYRGRVQHRLIPWLF